MPVIIIPIVVGFLIWLQRFVYKKFWAKNLDADAKFVGKTMVAGQEVEIEERMANAKLLPLPWVQMKFEIFRNGKTANLFRSDLFNILFNQQIIRKSRMLLKKRGVYQINRVSLFSSDLFVSTKLYKNYDNRASLTVFPEALSQEEIRVPYEKLMGEIATKRYTLEDPFLFKGIREYQPEDGFKNINFKASARNNRWLVNTHEYTLEQKVRILLLCDQSFVYADEDEYEAAVSYAAALTEHLEEDGIPVMLETNAVDALEGGEPRIEAGCSKQHTDAVLEILSRVDVNTTLTSGPEMVRALMDDLATDEYYIIISPEHGRHIVSAFQELTEQTESCMFISPMVYRAMTSMTDEEKSLPEQLDNFFYYKV